VAILGARMARPHRAVGLIDDQRKRVELCTGRAFTMQERNIATTFGLTALLAISIPASAANMRDSGPVGAVKVRNPSTLSQCDQGPMVIPPCPAGTTLVIHDQPVYDENGLFIICLEKVPYCLPDDLRPQR
jgi:hypothetical protein